LKHFFSNIGGRSVTTNRTYDVKNPATARSSRLPEGSVELLDQAVKEAREALPALVRLERCGPRAGSLRVADVIERHLTELSHLVTRGAGQSPERSRGKSRSGRVRCVDSA